MEEKPLGGGGGVGSTLMSGVLLYDHFEFHISAKNITPFRGEGIR